MRIEDVFGASVWAFILAAIITLFIAYINESTSEKDISKKPVDIKESICYKLYAEKSIALDATGMVINEYKDKMKCERNKQFVLSQGKPFYKAWCIAYECN